MLETQCTKNRTDDEWLFPELDQEGEASDLFTQRLTVMNSCRDGWFGCAAVLPPGGSICDHR